MEKLIKKGLIIGIPLLAVFYFLLQPGESEVFPPCIFHSATGLYCPGCGSQRAFHDLLHLNLDGVIRNNVLFIPAFLVVGYHYFRLHMNLKLKINLPDILYLKSTPWIILGIVLLFWILRNLPFSPFSKMAPHELPL